MQPRLISDLICSYLCPRSPECATVTGRMVFFRVDLSVLKCLVRFSRCPFLRSFEISVFCTGHRFILSEVVLP